MTKHAPATKLPWTDTQDGCIDAQACTVAIVCQHVATVRQNGSAAAQDTAYIAHASNSYPGLVQALQDIANECDDTTRIRMMRAILRKLGE